MYRATGWDPDGYGDKLNAIVNHPWEALGLKRMADSVLSHVQDKFAGGQLGDSPADAYRHALWNAVMTAEYGFEVAKSLGDAHERGEFSGRLMDLINNHNGRIISLKYNGKNLEKAIERALKFGRLQTRKVVKSDKKTGNLKCEA